MTAPLSITAFLIPAFGWALLHSIWQGFLVFACLRLVLRLWPNASASIKYNLSFLSLTGIFAWFSITLWEQLQAIRKVQQASWLMIETGVRQQHLEVPAIYHNQRTLTHLFPALEACFPLLVVLYITGVAVMSIKLTLDLVQLKQIRQKQVLPIDHAWEKHLEKLAQQLRIPRKVQLLISTHIQVPVMIGFLKPVILLPVAMFNNLSAEQLEAILLHELAHIKRNDYLLNIFQSIVETILFFNPFVWWISKNIRLEREHCCDDLVLAGQVQPLHYAKALVALEEYRLTVNALAMAAADNKQHLFHRIKRIMEMKTKNINYTQKLLAVMIIAVSLIAIAWLNPISARSKHTAKKNVVTTESATFVSPVLATLTQTLLSPDTTAPKRNERALTENEKKHLDEEVDKATNEAMHNIDWNQINNEVADAMKNVDWDEINKNVENAIKSVDWDQINKEVETSLKDMKDTNVDPAVIKESIRIGMESAKKAMQEYTIPAVKMGLDEAQKAMNSPEVKQAMKQASEQVKLAMTQARAETQKAMAEAHAQAAQAMVQARVANQQAMVIAKTNAEKQEKVAREQLVIAKRQQVKAEEDSRQTDKEFHELIDKMIADKLIDPKAGYVIRKEKGDLYINDVKQSDDVANKYKKYLDKKNINYQKIHLHHHRIRRL